ncbi:DNA polymerase I [Pokkaliibacter plantistimulans]|uniref:DNA polymerase I n=1 Tax=Pokkaliibacter plantistimulans TaxID=1635171 RepID=A0ABX5M224_9GAMM|nr:DNA polymerase I [Pokkaliibacter plantistimulans]PXF32967.1 DNA polymerase I [Pokkaliibacter plantistimulans]
MTDTEHKAPLILVDGSSYLYRAYHALPPLTNKAGQPTGAIKGVLSMLRSLRQAYPDSLTVVVFDAKGKTFRDDLYPEYKAHRPPMPDDLRSQIEPLHQAIRALGYPLLAISGVEADDVIGTLATQAWQLQQPTVISTGDKDMAQLVNEHVTLVNTMTDSTMDIEGVKEKFGVAPDRIIDYLALMGDKVDNVPGVPSVGPKTAVKWLSEFGSLEQIVAQADSIKGKVGEKLREFADQLPLSKQLVTIRCDVELPQPLTELVMLEPEVELLKSMYAELEFRGWLKELEQGKAIALPESAVDSPVTAMPSFPVEVQYHTVLDEATLDNWLTRLAAAEVFAFDTETTSLNYMEAELVGLSFAITPGEAAYVPLAHDYLGAPDQLDRHTVLARLKPLLEDASKAKVGQHLKYDMSVLDRYGIALRGIVDDTMLASYVLNSTATRHNMDELASFYLEYKTTSFEDIAGKGVKQLTFNQIEMEKASPYACEDADITLRLHQVLQSKLAGVPTLKTLLTELELPLAPILSAIERTGALVDEKRLHQQSEQLAKRLQELEREAHDMAGEPFNLGSTKQLGEILYGRMNLPVLKKTPKGQPSTAEEVLVELALDYPLPKLILEHRSLSKLKSTYTDKLPEMINPRTGRVHTSYHQAVTATGRLSSSDPNLQNIPIRSEEGRRIRQAFIAPQGYKLMAADYSQIELRIMAHLSDDAGLLAAFAHGDDIHKATAAEVFGVGLEQVSADQRRSAKAINFGLIYGMSAFGLAKQLGIGRNDAQLYIDRYFARYPGVKDYMNRTRSEAAERGYVETLFGRRLYLPEIKSSNAMRRQGAERTAINAPMQGTAADIIKRAMLQVNAWLQSSGLDARIIMQVHDELVLEVREEQVDAVKAGLQQAMSAAAELKVPLLVEVGVGDNWDEAH